ncbi:MAG: Zn-ribbon domain-containing OB-fold protein [Promethearchaeota archaeon]
MPAEIGRAKADEWIELAGTGEIYALTQVGYAPPAYKPLTPYILAVGQLDEGPLVVARVEDAKFEDLKIGTKIKVKIKKAFDVDSYVFVPA